MKINYCLPIIKPTTAQVMATIQENMTEYDMFEVWLDYINEPIDTFITSLIDNTAGKLILLFRRQHLEPIHMDMDKRRNIINQLANKNVYLDLDIAQQQEELEYIKENNLNVRLITSCHNYDQTPSSEELQQILQEMHYYNPEIVKVATQCQTENDAVVLLQTLLLLKDKGRKYIVLGMGEQGSITRIFGTLWGNEMIFAPKEKTEISAPGQLTKSELETIFKILAARPSC